MNENFAPLILRFSNKSSNLVKVRPKALRSNIFCWDTQIVEVFWERIGVLICHINDMWDAVFLQEKLIRRERVPAEEEMF